MGLFEKIAEKTIGLTTTAFLSDDLDTGGTVDFDVVTAFSQSNEAEVTRHAVEEGAPVTDNVKLNPYTLDMTVQLSDEIILFEPKTERAVPLEILEKEGKIYNKNITMSRSLASTIKKLKKKKSNKDVVLICGSLYLVGEARSILLKKKQDI